MIVTPNGTSPEIKETGPLKPPEPVMLIGQVVLPPCHKAAGAGLLLSEKLPGVCTISTTGVDCVSPSLVVPITVSG